MKLAVCLPTYRRAGALVWSLESVLAQSLEGLALDAPPRLVVLNNDRERVPVERAVETATREIGARGWELRVVHRDPPMDPARNWYEGIREHAHDDGVVFLHGDDDVIVRDGLRVRAKALVDSNATVLVSQPIPRYLVFEGSDAWRAWIEGDSPLEAARGDMPTRPALRELHRWGFAFIGNLTYRNRQELWRDHDATVARLSTLPLTGTQQLAMLPYFLTIEACRQGRVAATEARCVLRGHNIEEIVGVRFAHPNWRPGVLYAITMRMLESGEFGAHDDVATMLAQNRVEFARWYLPTMYDAVSRAQMRALGRDGVTQFGIGDVRPLVESAALLAKGLLGVQNLRRRLHGWGTPWSRRALIELVAGDAIHEGRDRR